MNIKRKRYKHRCCICNGKAKYYMKIGGRKKLLCERHHKQITNLRKWRKLNQNDE